VTQLKIKILKLIVALFIAVGLSGCAALVTKYIQNAGSFDYASITADSDIEGLGFKKGKLCSADPNSLCISYFSGKAISNKKLQYTTELTDGMSSTTVSLNLSRESVPPNLSGTVVLFHGFRASKEFMLNSALYFRFLGFDVLLPDLLGHGESGGRKAYGVNDRHILNALITAEHASGKHLYLVGNSMGAVSAVYLTAMRPDIDGIILQAPMLKFDEAVLRYMRTSFPHLQRFIGDDDIANAAMRALMDANIELEETDIGEQLSSSAVPVLLFASSDDPVAPYDKFAHLNAENISVIDLPGRNHPSMSLVGNESSTIIVNWLSKLAN
jgi:pimeloyl-ACP methyl ester carboxylesterase